MSYFQTRFSGAPVPSDNAMQVRQFMENMKRADEQRRDKAKALAEDQKRLELLAMGHGLEKGEAQSMSRAELSAFIENKSMQVAQGVQQRKEQLELAKFMQASEAQKQDLQMRKEASAIQDKFAQANLINAQTARDAQNQAINKTKMAQQELEQNANALRNAFMNPFDRNANPSMNNAFNQMPTSGGKLIGTDAQILDRFNTIQDEQLKAQLQAPKQDPNEKALLDVHTSFGREVAKDMANYINEGGPAGTKGRVRELSKVLNALKSGDVVTGKLVTFFGETARKFVGDTSMEAQQQAGRIVAQELRATLGAQFTAQEARDLLNRSFDPQMPTGTNIERLKAVITESIERENSKLGLYNIMTDPSVKSPTDMLRLARERNVFQSQSNQYMPTQNQSGTNKTKLPSGNSASAKRLDLDPTGKLGIVDNNASQ